MVGLCPQCGEDVPGGGGCPRCHAPEPRWRVTPHSLRSVLVGFLEWFFMALGGAMCLLVAYAFCHDWIGPGLGQRILQVVLGVVVVGVGLPVGLMLLWSSFAGRFVRTWTHPTSEGRSASATTRFGRLLAANGAGRAIRAPLDVPANALTGLEAFAHYGVLRRAIPARYGLANSPPRVDVALMAALLALAGRRRVQLRVTSALSWSHDGKAVTRNEWAEGVEVRRTDALVAGTSVDPVEAVLLGALATPDARVFSQEGPLPYRAAAAAEPDAEAPWARLPQVIFAIAGGDARFRRGLRAEFTAAIEGSAPLRTSESVADELVATLEAAGDRTFGATIVRQVEQGFAMRDPVPSV